MGINLKCKVEIAIQSHRPAFSQKINFFCTSCCKSDKEYISLTQIVSNNDENILILNHKNDEQIKT